MALLYRSFFFSTTALDPVVSTVSPCSGSYLACRRTLAKMYGKVTCSDTEQAQSFAHQLSTIRWRSIRPLTIVAIVFDKAPMTKALPGVILPPGPSIIGFKRSNEPYVRAGLTVRTKLALRPRHSPVMPSSVRISLVVWKSDWCSVESCCRVATTDTGMVKT